MKAKIIDIEYYIPEKTVSNADLVEENPSWNIDKIYEKTGINNRYIANKNQTSVDLAVEAGNKILNKGYRDVVDYIILCTQSPDYFLPTSACILQDRLGLGQAVGAIDVNQGCSGFIYSLGLAKGLIESNQAKNVLVLTAETYSKFIHPKDKSVRTLFGDAASCALISAVNDDKVKYISEPVYGTDGSMYDSLIVPDGGMKNPYNNSSYDEYEDKSSNIRSSSNLYMDGNNIFLFTLSKVPKLYSEVLEKESLTKDDIDIFILHQANKFMLDSLQKKLDIPDEKMHRSYQNFGNTVSSTIPIGLKIEMENMQSKEIKCAMLLGFGVGLSWAGLVVRF